MCIGTERAGGGGYNHYLSNPAETKPRPSLSQAIPVTHCVCSPAYARACLPVATSHRVTTGESPLVNTLVSSGLHAIQRGGASETYTVRIGILGRENWDTGVLGILEVSEYWSCGVGVLEVLGYRDTVVVGYWGYRGGTQGSGISSAVARGL